MKRVLRNVEQLLVPGPKKEERGTLSVVTFLLYACGLAFFGILGALGGTYSGFPLDSVIILFFAAAVLVFAVLHALPPHRRRARLVTRMALTLAGLAFVIWFPIARIGLDPYDYGTPVAALLVLALLCLNYFCNRRRARR